MNDHVADPIRDALNAMYTVAALYRTTEQVEQVEVQEEREADGN